MSLALTHFAHPDYLVTQSWVYNTYLSTGAIKQMGP